MGEKLEEGNFRCQKCFHHGVDIIELYEPWQWETDGRKRFYGWGFQRIRARCPICGYEFDTRRGRCPGTPEFKIALEEKRKKKA